MKDYLSLDYIANETVLSIIDTNQRIVKMNQPFLNQLSLSKEDVVGKQLNQVIQLTENEKFLTACTTCLQEPSKNIDLNVSFTTPTKNIQWFNWNISAHTIGGKVKGLQISGKNISLQKKYEESLVCQEALMNSISEAVISTDTSFVIKSWNKASEKIYQVKREDAIGKPMHEVMSFTIINGTFEEANQLILITGSWIGESILHCPDGKELRLQSSVNSILNNEGQLIGYVATSRDITEIVQVNDNLEKEKSYNISLKKATEKLVALQNQFNAFMDHSPAISWIVDSDGIFNYFNPLFLKIFHLSKDHVGKHVSEIFPHDVAEEYLRNNNIVFETGKPLEIIEIGEEPSGKRTIYKVLKFPLNIPGNKKFQGGIAIDITSEIEKQQELAMSNERFGLVNKATSDLIWDWDVVNDNILHGNRFNPHKDAEKANYGMEESLNKINAKDRERIKSSLLNALSDPSIEYWKEEYSIPRSNGKYKTVIDKAYIIRNEEGKAIRVIGALHDITEIKELEHQLNEQQKSRQREIVKAVMDAQEKERHEIAYELHDNVNQLLTTCKLQLEVADYYKDDKTYLTRISSYMQSIIDEIRSISHQLNPSNLEIIGLVPSIEDMLRKVNTTGKLKVDFETIGIKENCRFDKEIELSIFRIVQEQIQNIIKHSGSKNAKIVLIKNEKELSVLIEDNGKGFSLKDVKKGLGLTNIINRAEYYGGNATINTAIGKGCKILVKLPL